MNSALKKYGIYSLVLVAGLLLGIGLSIFGTEHLLPQPDQQIPPRTAILSVLDEEIMSLTYRTEKLTLTAQRSRPADRFAVQVTYADGREAQQCLATSELGGQLSGFSTITATRQVAAKQFETEYPRRLGSLEIRDRMIAEPTPPMEFRTTTDRNVIAVLYNGTAVEIDARIEMFAKLESGCKALAER